MSPSSFARQIAARRRGDAGFSLLEVLVTIVITSLIVGPLLAWMLLVMREQPVAQDGMIRTSQAGILRSYFPQDVANAGLADNYQALTPEELAAEPRLATWRQECIGGGGQDGRPVVMLLERSEELVKTIYSVAQQRNGDTPVDGATALWRDRCNAETGELIETTQLVEGLAEDVPDPPDGDTVLEPVANPGAVAKCSPTLANEDEDVIGNPGANEDEDVIGIPGANEDEDANPDAPCRQIRLTLDTLGSGGVTRSVELSATRRTDVRSLEEDPAGNLLPIARIEVLSRQYINDGTPTMRVSLTGAPSEDPDGEPIASYRWELPTGPEGSGALVEVREGADQVEQIVDLRSVGVYWARLTVTDSDGGTSTSYRRIGTVVNRPPTAVLTVGPNELVAGESQLAMSAAGSSDIDGAIGVDSYSWRLSSTLEAASGIELVLLGPDATWEVPEWAFGNLVVELTVTDDLGSATSSAEVLTIVQRDPPPGDEDPDPDPGPVDPDPGDPDPVPGAPAALFSATVGADRSVTFDASTSSGSIVSYAWQFGLLAGTGSGAVVTHTYPAPGTYTAVLTVTDDQGRTSSRTQLVVIPGAPLAPLNVRVVGRDLVWDPRPGARRYLVDLESVGPGCARTLSGQAVAASESPRRALPPNPCTGESTVRARVGTEAVAGGDVAWSAWISVPSEVVK